MTPEGKLILTVLGIYYAIGLILALSCRIWYLKTGDAYHLERMNPFAYLLGNSAGCTFFAWPFYIIVACITYIIVACITFFTEYLPYKITGRTDLPY